MSQPTIMARSRKVPWMLLLCLPLPFFISVAASSLENVTTTATQQQPTNYVPPSSKTPQDFLVVGLEEHVPAFSTFDGLMYAGLLPTTPAVVDTPDLKRREVGDIFFWMLAPHAPMVDDTIVIWFNGGPGCSSIAAGLLFETGPVTVPHHPAGVYSAELRPPLVRNPFAWTNATTMMYVEQPVGTGFTSGPEPRNEEDISQDFYYFLQNLFEVFPNLRSKRVFLFGESYAGMFVPSIGRYIHKANKKQDVKLPAINLAGIALGNGWIDARVQGPATIDYAWWHGMIDSVTRDRLHKEWRLCFPMSKVHPPFHRFTVPDECGIMSVILAEAGGAGLVKWGVPNEYDVTTFDHYPALFDHSINGTYGGFFNNPQIRQKLHVTNDKYWLECIPGSGRRRRRLEQQEEMEFKETANTKKMRASEQHLKSSYLDDDEPISVVPYIAELLDDAHIQVLIYNGDRDLSTNAQGSELLLNSMKWKGSKGWADPNQYQRGLWLVQQESPHVHENEMAGYMKTFQNLSFLVVYNSGHLLPYNQPRNALDLVTRFLRNESFVNTTIPPYRSSRSDRNHFEHLDGFKQLQEGEAQEESLYLSEGGIWVALVAGAVGFVAGVMFAFVMPKLTYKRSQYHQL